ncbi:MAG: hypothetical protein ACHQEM_04395 [Chitinophagales bacterium]
MSEQQDEPSIHSPKGRKHIRWWNIVTLMILVTTIIIIIGITLVRMEYRNKEANLVHYRQRMDPEQTEPGLTPAELTLPDTARPVTVTTGMYVDRIVEISMKDLSWTVDCYIWFNWQDSSLNPADNFQIVDGWIESKEKKDEYIKGKHHYVLYRIVARITSIFDETRFPCDDHLLTICVEDPAFERTNMIFNADSISSSISSRVKIPGYQIYKQKVVEKPHSYKTSRGDPRLAVRSKATFSQFRMGIWIKRDGWGFFLKLFLPLFVAVSVAILAFFIKPTDIDPRFGLGVGALFAAVANSYITSSMLPNTGVMSLADILNVMGTITILLTLVESTVSLFLYDRRGRKMLSNRFDRLSFFIILPAYILLNTAMAWAAAL